MSHYPIKSWLATGVAALPLLVASSALAAPLRTPIKAEKSYAASLQDATNERAVRTLDWRTPSVELRFDLSKADVINDLSVTISADPLPGVDPSLPLTVQFNNGEPMPIRTSGQGFDATVSLDASRVRAVGNVLRLSHAVPCGTKTGGYAISLDRSRIDMRARPKSRRLQLREFESRLSASAFAPETVGLIATGPQATQLQALGAQAVGLRMASVPDFRTTLAGTDFDIVMAKRSELYRYTTESDILSGEGAAIALSREHPDRLFLTGDTDAQVLQTVRAFSTSYLPRSRRSQTSPGEVLMQSPLDYARTTVDGTVRLDALSLTSGALREYVFDVADPAASSGDLVLRLTRDSSTEPGAALKAVLNGESLGEARLDGRRKTVSYPIREGQLRGSGNRLELTTKAANDTDACAGPSPFISIGEGSKLRLSADVPSAPTDLSRLSANGSVFGQDQGANAQIVLPSRAADFNAALRVVARLGTATGHGWTRASFHRGDAPATDQHVLLIEPFDQIDASVRTLAPRGLQSAWRGQPTDGSNRLASAERFASLDGEEAVRLAARRLKASGRVGAGGVAAVFPGQPGQLIGVISNTPGRSFSASIEPLATDAHWNGMSGGVSRWNERAVVMAQAALPAPGIAGPMDTRDDKNLWERFASFDLDTSGMPDFSWPEFDLADRAGGWMDSARNAVSGVMDRGSAAPDTASYTLPDFGEASAPAVGSVPTPRVKPAAMRVAEAPRVVAPPKVAAPKVAVPKVAVPKASPPKVTAPKATVLPAKAAPQLAPPPALRGTIDLSKVSAPKAGWSFKRLRRDVRSAIRRAEVKAGRWRRSLRNRTGMGKAELPGIRLGGYEIPPVMWMLLMAATLCVIGLGFITATGRGSNHH